MCWTGSAEARTGMERGFQHGPMKAISNQFQKKTWTDWHGNQQPIPPAIQEVARAFVYLQDERHTADYDNHEHWTGTDVQEVLNIAREAFQHWHSIRTDPMAGKYLLAMLLGKQRP